MQIQIFSFITEFQVALFQEFADSFKISNKLAPETLLALDNFLDTLDAYIELFQEQSQYQTKNIAIVKLYELCIIADNTYIRAKNSYYNMPAFDNIAIEMSEDEYEIYLTDKGFCFGKVCKVYLEKILQLITNFYL